MRKHWQIWFISIFNIIVIVIFMTIKPFNDWSGNPDADLFAKYGTFINGLLGTLLALTNSILIYITFFNQRNQFNIIRESQTAEIERQRLFFQTERFENRFFDMIKSNRDMLNTMEYEVPDEYTQVEHIPRGSSANKHNFIIVSGQKVFVQIHKQIKQAKDECSWILKEITHSHLLYKDDIVAVKENIKLANYYNCTDDLLFLNIHWLNIIYLCIFFGLGEEGERVLRSKLGETYNSFYTDKIINTLKLKPVRWSDFWSSYEKIKLSNFQVLKEGNLPFGNRKYDKYYGGHVHRLGQYFRNLFTICNFVNNQTFDYETKYEYIKLLRSQFSTYEQSVFFYNSLSVLGRIWEIDSIKNDTADVLIDKQLITKYNLVKNIPNEFISDFDIDKYYPLVEFELGKAIPLKEELKKIYK
jgi:hypothetical protein